MGLHPLLHLLATRPEGLAEHARAYAALLEDEATCAATHWQTMLCLQLLAAACLAASLGVAGVAVLLMAVSPQALMQAPGLCALALALPLAPGLLCLGLIIRGRKHRLFPGLREQVQADLALLKEGRAP